MLDPHPFGLVEEPGDEVDPTREDVAEEEGAGRGHRLGARRGRHAPLEALLDRRADPRVEELGVVVAGDKDDRIAGLEEADERVLDPWIGVEGGVEAAYGQRLAFARALAGQLDVPEVDEVAVDDQLPGTDAGVVLEETRQDVVNTGREVDILPSHPRL